MAGAVKLSKELAALHRARIPLAALRYLALYGSWAASNYYCKRVLLSPTRKMGGRDGVVLLGTSKYGVRTKETGIWLMQTYVSQYIE